MKTNVSLRILVLSVVALVCSLTVSARNDNNLIYNSEQRDGMLIAQTVYKQDGNSLSNYIKYNYKYDDQKRMTENETLKWNSINNCWENDLSIRYKYEGKTVTTDYYKWNNKKAEYILAPEMTITMEAPNL
ncbi:DUF3836 domain-containing protein [uncultured Bacteroides sp.]|uniref:DUF3836 domain-containing protein n=1 Tax=uncultured Bacteroides sp. TaxID=162156 RepID=UPI002AA835F1|nr:DUF3836 domain-containing protein [uncultured Bacteroides sp.]